MNSPIFRPIVPLFVPVMPDRGYSSRHDAGFGGMPVGMRASRMSGVAPGSLSASADGTIRTPGGYTINAGARDDGGAITITGPDGKASKIWGDPHFEGDSKFDFKGTTSFTLPDNTKLTISTKQNPDGTWSSDSLTATNGSSGVRYGNLIGDPSGMTMSTGYGPMMDAMTDDGNELYLGRDNVVRGLNGYGGMSTVNQNYIDRTDDVINPFGAARKDAVSWLQQMLGGSFDNDFLSNYGGFGLSSMFSSRRHSHLGSLGFAFMPGKGMWQPAF